MAAKAASTLPRTATWAPLRSTCGGSGGRWDQRQAPAPPPTRATNNAAEPIKRRGDRRRVMAVSGAGRRAAGARPLILLMAGSVDRREGQTVNRPPVAGAASKLDAP